MALWPMAGTDRGPNASFRVWILAGTLEIMNDVTECKHALH